MNRFLIDRLYVLFWFLLIQAFCLAQDEAAGFQGFATPGTSKQRSIIKSNIIPLFVGEIDFCGELRITYEQMVAKRQSVTVGLSYDYPNFILLAITTARGGRGGGRYGGGGFGRGGGLENVDANGGRLTLGYRYYPLKKLEGPKGFFVGPYLSYSAVNIKEKDNSSEYEVVNYANASAIAGYQFVFLKHISLEFFGGLGYKNNFVLHYNQQANEVYRGYAIDIPAFDNVKWVLQMNIGYVF